MPQPTQDDPTTETGIQALIDQYDKWAARERKKAKEQEAKAKQYDDVAHVWRLRRNAMIKKKEKS